MADVKFIAERAAKEIVKDAEGEGMQFSRGEVADRIAADIIYQLQAYEIRVRV